MIKDNNIYSAIYKVNHAGGTGSCFYIKKYNLFVTNYHVVEGYRDVAIQDNNKNAFLARVVLVNPKVDIALLAAEGDFSSVEGIVIPESADVSLGQRINVAGYPFGMPFTVTEGTVSSAKQLVDNNYYIQTDAAVNPGNSGGPMLNEKNELVAVTVSKFTEADNVGFGIPVDKLKEVLDSLESVDTSCFNLQCNSCETAIVENEEEFCPSCGAKLPENIFKVCALTDLATFCESAIAQMGINPILARVGQEHWRFHKGSSQIRMFIYDSFLCCTSPINNLPKKELEPVLTYLVESDFKPYKMGVSDNEIYLTYRVHISDVFSDYADQVNKNITGLALKADDLDNYLLNTFGCELSEHAKKE